MKPKPPKSVVENFTRFIGSVPSLILHTFFFIAAFIIAVLGFATWEMVLLVLTTMVSLEAIYLAIFIQITVNQHGEELQEVGEDVEDIQEDLEEIGEDIEELGEEVDDIQEDLEEIQSDDEKEEQKADTRTALLSQLTADVNKLLQDLEELKKK